MKLFKIVKSNFKKVIDLQQYLFVFNSNLKKCMFGKSLIGISYFKSYKKNVN